MKEYVKEYLKNTGIKDPRELKNKNHADFVEKVKTGTAWLPVGVPVSFRIQCILDGLEDIPICKNPCCDKKVSVKTNQNKTQIFDVRVFSEYCSRSCMRSCPEVAKKRMDTIVSRFGDHNMRTAGSLEKFKSTCIEKYGVDNPNKMSSVREKIKNTNIELYGSVSFLSSEEGIAKKTKTIIERYGVDHPMKCETVKKKCRDGYLKTVILKYGVDHTTKHNKTFSHIVEDDKAFIEFCSKYQHTEDIAAALEYHPSRIRARMAECGISKETKTSYPEKQIKSFIESFYTKQIIVNDRKVLGGRELDLYIPEAKIAIEFNGMYWHSEKYSNKYYHQKKTLEAMKAGVRLIHIWETDWEDENKKELLMKKIKTILGHSDRKVYARNCTVTKIETPTEFYTKNHIQGPIMASITYGLFHQGELIASMSFRKTSEGSYDLVRYASSVTAVGGFSKILSAFKKQTPDWEYIYTYASLDYSNGSLYETCGFSKEHITPPNYVYFSSKKNTTLSRYQTMKHKLKNILGDSFDETLTEKENMEMAGWFRVYDAGSIKYSIKNPLI